MNTFRQRLRAFLYRMVSIEIVPCPTCGRTLKVDSVAGSVAGGYWHLERPKSELEAICGKQHGTDHDTPMH